MGSLMLGLCLWEVRVEIVGVVEDVRAFIVIRSRHMGLETYDPVWVTFDHFICQNRPLFWVKN